MTVPFPKTDVDAPPEPPDVARDKAVVIGGFVLICLLAVLAALWQVMLVPLYVGDFLLRVSIPLALVTNLVLPRMARSFVDTIPAAFAPVVVWLLTVLALSSGRPEGDVLVPGGKPYGMVFYAMLIVGTFAGAATVMAREFRAPVAHRDH